MMEVNMDMDDDSDSQRKSVDNLNTEPEVIPLDSDDDMPAGGQNRNMFNQLESGEASEPVLLNVDQRIFQIDDDENVTEMVHILKHENYEINNFCENGFYLF